ADGVLRDLGPGDLSCHACTRVGDDYVFDSGEPRLFFSPPGPVGQLEVAGHLELVPPGETLGRLTAALAEKQATVEHLTRQVEALEQATRARRSLWARVWRRAA